MNTFLKEYRWPFVVSLLILVLSSAPTLAGYAAQTPDQRFIGAFYGVQDYAVHLAMTHYGEQGGWDYQFRFTNEPQNATYLKTIYVILGHLGKLFGIPADVLFQLERLLFGLLACLSIYFLMTRVFARIDQRRLAFVLAILGAGLGWIQMPLGLIPNPSLSPADVWFIDAYVFFDMMTLPHLALVIAGIAVTVALFLDYVANPHWKNIAVIAVCVLMVQFINPIAFVIVDAALAGIVVFTCWQKQMLDWKLMGVLALLALIQVPIMAYSVYLITYDPGWKEFNRQFITLALPPLYLLLGFGLFWPFAAAGTIQALRQRDARLGWALTWAVAAIALSYLPLGVQRRFLLGITLPLAVLAAPAILDLSVWLHERLKLSKLTGAILIGFVMVMTPLFMVASFSRDMTSRPTGFFEPVALFDAADWLNQHGTSAQVALAAEPTAQLIAMRSPLTLYFGHVMETFRYDDKAREVEAFYRGQQSTNWLEQQRISWVVFGPHEKEWAQHVPNLPNLQVAYQNHLVTIYRVASP